MVTSKNTTEAFSRAAHEIIPGNPLSSVKGPIEVELQDNGVVKVSLGKDRPDLMIDTRSGLLSSNDTTTSMQWSNSYVEAFLESASNVYKYGQRFSSGPLDVRHTGSTSLITFDDKAILISRSKDGNVGAAVFTDGKGIQSAEIEAVKPVLTPVGPRSDLGYGPAPIFN